MWNSQSNMIKKKKKNTEWLVSAILASILLLTQLYHTVAARPVIHADRQKWNFNIKTCQIKYLEIISIEFLLTYGPHGSVKWRILAGAGFASFGERCRPGAPTHGEGIHRYFSFLS